jgi:hypothetical protein
LKSYLGLLCLGKNDFDAIEAQRTDAFFTRALHLRTVPSSPTLRQRFDTHASDWFELAERINAAVLSVKIAGKPINFGLLPCGYLPLDVDTFAMDNSGTAKEHVGRTYTGVDGYCPLAAYLGTQGFCLELALRPGTQHSACETEYNIERVLPLAARVSAGGSGGANGGSPAAVSATRALTELMCAIDSQAQQLKRAVAFIIKWNPRNTPVETIAKAPDAGTAWALARGQARVSVEPATTRCTIDKRRHWITDDAFGELPVRRPRHAQRLGVQDRQSGAPRPRASSTPTTMNLLRLITPRAHAVRHSAQRRRPHSDLHGQARPPVGTGFGSKRQRLRCSSGTGKSWTRTAPPEGGSWRWDSAKPGQTELSIDTQK